MSKKEDLFLNYLDDQLSVEERKSFIERLKNDSIFNNEFKKFEELYNKSQLRADVDENYFVNLVPNARNRINANKRKNIFKYAYILPVIVFGLLLLYNNQERPAYNFDTLLESFTDDEIIAGELFENSFDNWNYLIEDDLIITEYFEDSAYVDESLFDYLSSNIRGSDISESFFNEISEDEFNDIYNELSETKFIGEK